MIEIFNNDLFKILLPKRKNYADEVQQYFLMFCRKSYNKPGCCGWNARLGL